MQCQYALNQIHHETIRHPAAPSSLRSGEGKRVLTDEDLSSQWLGFKRPLLAGFEHPLTSQCRVLMLKAVTHNILILCAPTESNTAAALEFFTKQP